MGIYGGVVMSKSGREKAQTFDIETDTRNKKIPVY